ncbi:RloB family protein [Limnofasciculus baicalensis]|uniref:RloB family protein n=1 Tax=Limnofasciculus baicalensis BBK-W-15 TaxID=2699891 RepID=A0AAE3GVC9_9CYAN|nr:RloB domain-containing protein [Limnofasciculus baicalensis]MCP2730473.1 RloB family protein [Limnofasciculus baicalensis BBK-W-15]
MSKNLKRHPPSRNTAKKILIACEGSKTEPDYFESIRQDLRLRTLQIIVLRHQGKTDPRSIIERVIEERQKMKLNQRWTEGDTAWAVFDGDEHIEKSLDHWCGAINRAKSQKIQLAITNPSFELWYLIHFRDQFSQINRHQAIALLKEYIPNYDKSKCFYPKPLKPLTSEAIKRGEKMAGQIQRAGLDEYSNPSCNGLPNLIRLLLNLEKS